MSALTIFTGPNTQPPAMALVTPFQAPPAIIERLRWLAVCSGSRGRDYPDHICS